MQGTGDGRPDGAKGQSPPNNRFAGRSSRLEPTPGLSHSRTASACAALQEKRSGTFVCGGCFTPLFASEAKYESGEARHAEQARHRMISHVC